MTKKFELLGGWVDVGVEWKPNGASPVVCCRVMTPTDRSQKPTGICDSSQPTQPS